MSRRGSFFIRFIGILVLVGVLFGVGALAFQAGQAQGYAMGLAVSGDAAAVPLPGMPGFIPGYGAFGWPFYGFAPMGLFIGLLCLFGLGLAFLFAIGAIFRPRHWHGYSKPGHPGDPQAEDWHRRWHAAHGGPPWAKETPPETPPAASGPAE